MEDNIKAKYTTKTGKTYIFLKDGSLLEEDVNGKIIKVDLRNEEIINRIKKEIGKGHTDVVR